MRKAMIFSRCTAAAILLWVAAIAIIEAGGSGCVPIPLPPEEIVRRLLGDNEVPPILTPAYGVGHYELTADGAGLRFIINASVLSSPVTAAHFHYAPVAEDGPVVFDLSPFLTQIVTDFGREVALAGVSSLADWSIENAAVEIRAGRIYVNLHTGTFPDGEIRGQVFLRE